MKAEIYSFLMRAGKAAGCHQLPERSFFYHGHQFPVCARCTGIILGQLLGMMMTPVFLMTPNWIGFFCFLMFFDWVLQRLEIMKSTNMRRAVTGFLCGMGLGQLYVQLIVRYIGGIFQ